MKDYFKLLTIKPILIISGLSIIACSSDDEGSTITEEVTEEITEEVTEEETTEETVLSVDASFFLTDTGNVTITTEPCTLSDGTETECYKIVSIHTVEPEEHEMGPWCPENISDDASAGGLWITDDGVVDVDGDFIKNLAEFYDDATWKMYDEVTGEVTRMTTIEECMNGADPNQTDFDNYCAQCLPEWVEAEVTYYIPVTPVRQEESKLLSDGPTLEEPGVDYGPEVRGLAFNGVRFDHPADIDIILSGYQIAPVDDAGGHVNNALGYHYHGDTGFVSRIEQEDGHAAMIGYALDGYGIYAQLDANGEEPTDLDDCRGHYDDIRGYHYHVMPLGNNEFFDCFYGAYVAEEEGEGGGPGGGGPPN